MYPQDPHDTRAWQAPPDPTPRRPAGTAAALAVILGGVLVLFAGSFTVVMLLVGSGTPEPVAIAPDSPIAVSAGRHPSTEAPPDDETQPADVQTQLQTQQAVVQSAVASQPAPHEPKVLLTDSGNGTKNTAEFTVDSSWQVHYTYDCSDSPAADGRGGMSATLMNGTTYVDLVLNELGDKADKTTPQYRAGTFHLEITAALCSWTIQVIDV